MLPFLSTTDISTVDITISASDINVNKKPPLFGSEGELVWFTPIHLLKSLVANSVHKAKKSVGNSCPFLKRSNQMD